MSEFQSRYLSIKEKLEKLGRTKIINNLEDNLKLFVLSDDVYSALEAILGIENILTPELETEISKVIENADDKTLLSRITEIVDTSKDKYEKSLKFDEERNLLYEKLKEYGFKAVIRIKLEQFKDYDITRMTANILNVIKSIKTIEDQESKEDILKTFIEKINEIFEKSRDRKELYEKLTEQLNVFQKIIYDLRHATNWGITTHYGKDYEKSRRFLVHAENETNDAFQRKVKVGNINFYLGSKSKKHVSRPNDFKGGRKRRKTRKGFNKKKVKR